MKSILNTQPLLQVDYIATDRVLENLSAIETELQDAGVVSSQWDPSSLPSGNLNNADLVVYNCSTSVLVNTTEIVSNLAAAVKEGGFVLLHTLLKGETLGEIVGFLTSPDLQQMFRKRGLSATHYMARRPQQDPQPPALRSSGQRQELCLSPATHVFPSYISHVVFWTHLNF